LSFLPSLPRAAFAALSTNIFPSIPVYAGTYEKIISIVRLLVASRISTTIADFHLSYFYRIESALLQSVKILITLGYYLGCLVSFLAIKRASLIAYSSASSASFPLPRVMPLLLKVVTY